MERTKKESALEEREKLRKQVAEDTRGIFSYLWPIHPIQLFVDLLWAIARPFSPLAPHLVPLAVFSVTLPLIILLSIGSGYFVWKSIAVSWETDLFLQYGCVQFALCAYTQSHACEMVFKSDGGIPHAELALLNVVPNQAYDISLHLVVPANEANVALGNFMASLTLSSPSNTTIADVRKPVCAPVILQVCQRS